MHHEREILDICDEIEDNRVFRQFCYKRGFGRSEIRNFITCLEHYGYSLNPDYDIENECWKE